MLRIQILTSGVCIVALAAAAGAGTVFEVYNLDDNGPGSLRQAVSDANVNRGADEIHFADGMTGTIKLLSGEIEIMDDVSIMGPGAEQLTISGEKASRIFRIVDVAVSIGHLTVADGRAGGDLVSPVFGADVAYGGGILCDGGNLELSHVTMTGNRARATLTAGGAVACVSGATLSVSHSYFEDNRSLADSVAAGGAIGADDHSTLTVEHSTFVSNRARTLQGFGAFGLATGGAIINGRGCEATISHSYFGENSTRGGDGDAGDSGAGADGGALTNANASYLAEQEAMAYMLVSDCTFVGNRAHTGAAGLDGVGTLSSHGGAIISTGCCGPEGTGDSELVVADSVFIDNGVTGGKGADGSPGHAGHFGGPGVGGAIEAFTDSTLTVTSSIFLNNHATGGLGGDGGDGAEGGTGGDGLGGAISAAQAVSVTLDGNVFYDNQAVGVRGGRGGASADGGQGGEGFGGAVSLITTTAAITDIVCLDNRVLGGKGGKGGANGNGGVGGLADGGAVGAFDGVEMELVGGFFLGNAAIGGRGGRGQASGVDGPGGEAFGGAIELFLEVSAVISDAAFVVNHAHGGDGSSGGNAFGGALSNDEESSSISLFDCVVTFNQAQGGSSEDSGEDGYGVGGGVFNLGILELLGTQILGNQADEFADCFGC